MIFLITGASHTGKTAFAQKLLQQYHYPYLSIDHLKMGLIRSGNTDLTPYSEDEDLTAYLWPIVREMIKTAIENEQNLIVEGVYIPSSWRKDFSREYLEKIKFCCIVFSENYIRNHFEEIKSYASVIEKRLYDDITLSMLIEDNAAFLAWCKREGENYLLIEDHYEVSFEE